MQSLKSEVSTSQPRPRCRVILEFVEGDTNRAPIIYTVSGSAEQDEQLREEILKRWRLIG